MRTLLVTGAAGFLGRHLCELAQSAGLNVVPLDRSGSRPVELLDQAAVVRLISETRPAVVFHLASLTSQTDLRALFEVNVTGTAVLCEALRGSSAHLVVVGSSSVYGKAGEAPVSEETPAAPRSLYGVSKWSQEAVALRAARVDGRTVTIARLFNLIGPGMPTTLLAGTMADQIARAEAQQTRSLRFGALTATRDFLDVRDAAAALLRLAEVAPSGPVNVCSGTGVPVSRCLEVLMGASPASFEVTADERLSRPDDIPVQVGSPALVQRLTGWYPRISLEQSLRDLLESSRRRVRQEQS